MTDQSCSDDKGPLEGAVVLPTMHAELSLSSSLIQIWDENILCLPHVRSHVRSDNTVMSDFFKTSAVLLVAKT